VPEVFAFFRANSHGGLVADFAFLWDLGFVVT
jgi:hypothetical protein